MAGWDNLPEKELKTRIQLKYDTLARWNNSDLVLKKGEIAIAEIPAEYTEGSQLPPVMFKVGNGTNTFSSLDWVSAKAADVYGWAKAAGLTISKVGEGNVVSGIEWDEKKKCIKFTTASVATSEGFEALGKDVDAIEKDIEDNRAAWAKDTTYTIAKDGKGITFTPSDADSDDDITTITFEYLTQTEIEALKVAEAGQADKVANALTIKVGGADVEFNGSAVQTADVDSAIGAALAEAKKYANDNDNDTKYHIEYNSQKKEIQLVAGADANKMTIDATDFIKDGMIDSVELENNNLVITWNTDAGKSPTSIPLTGLVDIYTGEDTTEIDMTVSSDKKISASIINASITEAKLAKAVTDKLNNAVTTGDFDEYKLALGGGSIQVGDAAALGGVAAADYLTKTVAASTYEPIGAESRANTYADGLAVNYATAAQGEKADTALQAVTTTANGGLVVSNKNQIDIDTNVVFVFNCGDSSEFLDE